MAQWALHAGCKAGVYAGCKAAYMPAAKRRIAINTLKQNNVYHNTEVGNGTEPIFWRSSPGWSSISYLIQSIITCFASLLPVSTSFLRHFYSIITC